MTEANKQSVAHAAGFIGGGVLWLLLLASEGPGDSALLAFKRGGQVGVFGWFVGYGLARLILGFLHTEK